MYVVFTVEHGAHSSYLVGDVVEFPIQLSDLGEDFEVFKNTNFSLNRRRFHRVLGNEETFKVDTAPIIGASDNNKVRMFLMSIASGQTFLANLNSNVNIATSSFQLDGKLKTPKKIKRNVYTYSFNLVAV